MKSKKLWTVEALNREKRPGGETGRRDQLGLKGHLRTGQRGLPPAPGPGSRPVTRLSGRQTFYPDSKPVLHRVLSVKHRTGFITAVTDSTVWSLMLQNW